MKLFLVRHAHAVDETENPLRPLSAKGRAQMQALATVLRAEGREFSPDLIWHSPLVRARETAELLVQHLGLFVPQFQAPGLTPEDDPRPLAKRLESITDTVAIVGHEPHLGMLAGLLVNRSIVDAMPFSKAEVRAYELTAGRWTVLWAATPPKP